MEHISVLSELKKFSVTEKILIVEELWESIVLIARLSRF